jgi:hypothetical protein
MREIGELAKTRKKLRLVSKNQKMTRKKVGNRNKVKSMDIYIIRSVFGEE